MKILIVKLVGNAFYNEVVIVTQIFLYAAFLENMTLNQATWLDTEFYYNTSQY